MRIYTLTGATSVDDPQYGRFNADANGAFDGLPDEMAKRLHSFHLNGKAAWETDAEREQRIVSEELDRMRDPATLLAAIKEMGAGNNAVMAALAAALNAPAPGSTPAAAKAAAVEAPTPAPAVESPAPVAKKRAASKRAAAAPAAE
jgi:predicted trehalose synthase